MRKIFSKGTGKRAKTWKPPFPEIKCLPKPVVVTKKIPKFADDISDSTPPPACKEEPVQSKETKNNGGSVQHHRQEFLRVFRSLTHRWRSWDIWTDFVTMSACAISNSVDNRYYEEREATYLQIIQKYSKEEQVLFPELLAHLVLALEEDPEQDFLGSVYTELGLNSKEHQQVFTPYDIAYLMAQMTYGDLEKQLEQKPFITIHDCCCGAGVTLIAAANVAKEQMRKKGLNYQYYILVTGQDIDRVVTMMSYIQLSLLGVAGYFKVGNSLTEPMGESDSLKDYWFTPMYFSGEWMLRRALERTED